MSRCSIYGLDAPDEKTGLALKDASPKEIIESVYGNWSEAVKSQYEKDTDFSMHPLSFDDALYDSACRMIGPFKEKIRGALDENSLELGKYAKHINHTDAWLASLYLSAVLNETDAEKFTARKRHGMGYRLKKGKTLEIGQLKKKPFNFGGGEVAFGRKGDGGTVINYGEIIEVGEKANLIFKNYGKAHEVGVGAPDGEWINYAQIGGVMGNFAPGGVWLNKGNAHMMGTYALGGVWLNHNKATQSIGGSASGGVFLNFGEALHMGHAAEGGVFVAKKLPKKGFMKSPTRKAYGVGPEELGKDAELSLLVDSVEEAGNEERFDDIRKLARQVDEHVRKNYRPRRVA